jgi:predicted unusual protein kinase regulating ubiquinone biosynthesis (AarF/ABC1/UbiB family)
LAHLAGIRESFGIRVPRLIGPLCTPAITAMSEESNVKVTDAFTRSPIRRSRIPDQLIEALIAVPLFCREDEAVFHADPHAGNLMYDETNRELVVMDWALAERLSLESRRQLVLLVVMMILRNPAGVRDAIRALSTSRGGADRERLIDFHVDGFFSDPPSRPLARYAWTPCACWMRSPWQESTSPPRCFSSGRAFSLWMGCCRMLPGPISGSIT